MDGDEKGTLNIHRGAEVWFEATRYTILSMLDLNTVLAKSHLNGQTHQLRIDSLRTSKAESATPNPINLVDVPEKSWAEAQRRFEIIKPLLEMGEDRRTVAHVEARAKEFNIGVSTLYRWIEAYVLSGLMSSLARTKRSDKGRTRKDPQVESIIDETIQNLYLNKQRIKGASVHEEVKSRCRKEGLKAPHINTIRNRIKTLPEALKVKTRRGKQAAKTFEPIRGHFPGADWPLAYVQIDHTPLDIILVDDDTRQPVGRPYITIALDIFSRMITGFYLSFDNPSCFTVGMCIAHSVLPKDSNVAEFGLLSDWPIQGKMKILHVDNALEFRSDILKRACDQHQIDIQWRPVREPQYGGHVERVIRTINTKIHELPGTTFSNIKEREYYNSDKYSAFTLKEFEAWLTTFIVDKYHHAFHSEIGMSPYKRYEQGILGDGISNLLGVGMPPRIVDQESFRIDFMPYVKRTIQQYGMRNDKIYYYHDVLRTWINATDPNDKKKKRRFVFHYDPRDVSRYYFWDPEIERYFVIPYRDNRRPAISMWEVKAANKKAREDGAASINEDLLFAAHEKLKQLTVEAVNKTRTERRKQRRDTQRKRDHKRQMERNSKNEGKQTESHLKLVETEVDESIEESEFFEPFTDISE